MLRRVVYALIAIVILLSIGTFTYHHLENWSYIDSLYFSTTTLTTVGYGDLFPTSNASKLFTVFYILIGVGLVLASITIIGTRYLMTRERKIVNNQIDNKIERKVLKKAIKKQTRRKTLRT